MILSGLLDRWRARLRLRGTVGLWYHPDYAPRCLEETCRVSVLPIDRVDRALARLVADDLLKRGDVRPSPIASMENLGRVHTARYIEAVGHADVLARIFGLEPAVVEADPLLLAQRRATGGTIEAARACVSGKLAVALNLGGGFHHAAPDQGGAFCVFNDLAVAVATVRAEGFAGPVLVVDLDYHQDDGTQATFAHDPTVATLSLHGSVWSHVEAENAVAVLLPERCGDEEYLARLSSALPPLIERHRPRLMLYLAGQDVLGGDRLGGFALTREGLLRRDAFVLEQARAAGVPTVVTLGGGYGDEAWLCVADLARLVLLGHADFPRSRPDSLPDHYRAVARTLDPATLRGREDETLLTEEDVLGQLSSRTPDRLLDFYSAHGVEYALESYGVLEKLRRRGFSSFEIVLDPHDPERQRVTLFAQKGRPERLRLVELVLARRRLPMPGIASGMLDVLAIEWMLATDPTASFTLERPALPGQDHPGLGVARDLEEMLAQSCRRLGLDGVLASPAHFHNAVLASRRFHFLDPAVEGRLLAVAEVLAREPLPDATALLEKGAVRTAEGVPLHWEPAAQVLPVSARLVAHFEGAPWRDAVEDARQRMIAAGLIVLREKPPAPPPPPKRRRALRTAAPSAPAGRRRSAVRRPSR